MNSSEIPEARMLMCFGPSVRTNAALLCHFTRRSTTGGARVAVT
jgi:hypothetical protein